MVKFLIRIWRKSRQTATTPKYVNKQILKSKQIKTKLKLLCYCIHMYHFSLFERVDGIAVTRNLCENIITFSTVNLNNKIVFSNYDLVRK